ncbi:hypothetical protein INT45_012416 [Circinella minor]|uniref:Thioredoxin n=1 Tax=Circinella minor TaxID=1195481 RepID=A0A8H7S392_9FUNG|nr:hypothetical protein INT45_012416 [Circinella minor]
MASVKELQTSQEFQDLLSQSGNKLVVVDFFATWCGPCHMIAPFFAQISAKYPHVQFAKVDVDRLRDVASSCKVTAMPTFQFFKSGQKVAELKGASAGQIEQLVKQHQGETASGSDGVSSNSGSKNNYGINGHSDLTDYITPNQMDALNQNEENNVKNVFKSNDAFLESDVDEQLIITVPFSQPVKIHSIKLKAKNIAQAPKTIKIYTNRQTLGFDDADSVKETQTIELEPKDFEEDAVINLRFVKFQNINSLVLFVQDNQEDEETTQIQQLIFIGSPIEATNMGNLKKGDEEN